MSEAEDLVERALLSNSSEEARRYAAAPPSEYETFVASVCTPDCEFASRLLAVEGAGDYRGLEGMIAYLDDISTALDYWEISEVRVRELEPGGVLATWRWRTRGRNSGIEIDQRIGGVAELRDGRISRLEVFLDPADAFAAAGVPPDALESR